MNYSRLQPSLSVIVFSAEKRIMHFVAIKIRNLLGNFYITVVLIHFGSYLFRSKPKFLVDELAFLPIIISFPVIISKKFNSRASKITLDLENEIIEINYFNFYNRKYRSKFKDTEVKFELNKDNLVVEMEFLNRKSFFYNTICFINLDENIFSKENYGALSEKLMELPFYKKF